MIVSAKQTTREIKSLNVEVNEKDVLYQICWNLLADKPRNAEYIKDGHWYVFSFTDHHKGTDEYEKDRVATPEEIKIYEAYQALRNPRTG